MAGHKYVVQGFEGLSVLHTLSKLGVPPQNLHTSHRCGEAL